MAKSFEKAYAGRWVACLRGKVIAHGGTPEQAQRAAQSRFKETPEIKFMPFNFPLKLPEILNSVREVLPEGLGVYLVGGAIRDALLGRDSHDLDFALERDGIRTARRVANALNADFYILDSERDTGRVIFTGKDGTRILMDFAAFRGKDLEADISGRDFTINAIALNLGDSTIHDPLGGAMDLKEKRLRACSRTALADDPIRILRGIRLAANFSLQILPETRKAMKQAANGLATVSPERMRDELFRIFDGTQPATCMRALDLLEALDKVLPELSSLKGVEQIPPHIHDVWEHSLSTAGHLERILEALSPEYDPEKATNLFDGMMFLRIGRYREQIRNEMVTPLTSDRSRRSLLFLAALYHDVAKPQTKKADEEGQVRFWGHDQHGAEILASRAHALGMSNDEALQLDTIVRNHMRILFHANRLLKDGIPPSRRAIYRFFRDTGPAGVEVCLLALADIRATYEETLPQDLWTAVLDVIRLLLENWYEKPTETIAPPFLVKGDDLMQELTLQPGKIVGDLLEAIREAQAMGEVTSREQALVVARKKLKELSNYKE